MYSGLAAVMREKKCFLFDLDGTLVDSSPVHERAYLDALAAAAPEIALRFRYEECKGRRTRDALRDYGIEDEALLTRLTEAKQQSYRDQVDAGAVQLLPYGRELLESLRRQSKRLFLVTGGSARSTRTVVRQLGILDWFEQIVTADDVANGKPSPDCWLMCCARADVSADSALAIEDALSGIESARAAGLACVGVNNPELQTLPEYAGTLEDLLRALTA